MVWSSVRDASRDGVYGMKLPYAIKPYSVSLSAENDGLIGAVVMNVKVVRLSSTNNVSNIQSATDNVDCGERTFSITNNVAFCEVLDDPETIPANTTWGVELTKTSGSTSNNPEIIVSIHSYQL